MAVCPDHAGVPATETEGEHRLSLEADEA